MTQWKGDANLIYCNHYCQVFGKVTYFESIYPIYSNSKAGYDLNIFCQEFGVTENITFDGYKEQAYKGFNSMNKVHKQGIYYNISEPDLHNHKKSKGFIREL